MSELSRQCNLAKISLIKRWIVDPQVNPFPGPVNYGEIQTAIEQVQERLDSVREEFTYDNEEAFKKEY